MEKKTARGFTLIEMTIVLALVAIVIAMTATFFSLTNAKSSLATKEYQAQSDLTGIEDTIKDWVRHYDSSRYIFRVSDDHRTISVFYRDDDPLSAAPCSVFAYHPNDKTVTVSTNDSLSRTIRLKRVDDLSLTVESSSLGDRSGSQRINAAIIYRDSRDEVRVTGYSESTHYTVGAATARVELYAGIASMIENYNNICVKVGNDFKYISEDLSLAGGRNGNEYANPEVYNPDYGIFPDGSHYYNPRTGSVTKVVFDYYDSQKYPLIPYASKNEDNAEGWYLLSTEDSEAEAWGYILNHVLYILTDPGVEIYATTMNRMFFGFTSLTEIENHNFHTDAATSWVRTFEGTALKSLDFLNEDNWKLENVVNMQFAFMDCDEIGTDPDNPQSGKIKLNINELTFDPLGDKTTYLFAMFAHCDNITEIDMSDSRIRCDMFDQVFSCLKNLTTVTLPSSAENFDLRGCITLWRLFYKCENLTTVNNSELIGLNAPYCGQLSGMFEGCSSLRSIDLSGLAMRSMHDTTINDPNVNLDRSLFFCVNSDNQPITKSGSTHYTISYRSIFTGCSNLSIAVNENSVFFPHNGNDIESRLQYLMQNANCFGGGTHSASWTLDEATGVYTITVS